MKKLILILLLLIYSLFTEAQRYEVWLNTNGIRYGTRWNLGYFNDSVMNIYADPRLFFRRGSENVKWDVIGEIRIRNKGRHEWAQGIGFLTGFTAAYLILGHNKLYPDSYDVMEPIMAGLIAFSAGGVGALIGYKLTGLKITIPLHGNSPKEKSRMFSNYLSDMQGKKHRTGK